MYIHHPNPQTEVTAAILHLHLTAGVESAATLKINFSRFTYNLYGRKRFQSVAAMGVTPLALRVSLMKVSYCSWIRELLLLLLLVLLLAAAGGRRQAGLAAVAGHYTSTQIAARSSSSTSLPGCCSPWLQSRTKDSGLTCRESPGTKAGNGFFSGSSNALFLRTLISFWDA